MPAFSEIETPNSPRLSNSHHLQSIMACSYPITLKFIDICYSVKLKSNNNSIKKMLTTTKHTCSSDIETSTATNDHQEHSILNGVTGMVSPGEILAVLGPSGSGKSTLLNALAGRSQQLGGGGGGGGGGGSLTGTVLANNKKLNKPVLKRVGFVTQDDMLYPHLTIRETLVFCALLRLPTSISKKDKISLADEIIRELGLTICENTIIGNSFIRGVSGGERKRVSIGHEMLINPSLLILDEPTSGLDSTAAFRLVSTLVSMAKTKGRSIVTSVHQPSSRVYQMFDLVLVMCEGRCIYYGKGCEAMNYFESIGFSPSFQMNPADFLLDLANGVCHQDSVSDREKPNVKQALISSYNTLLAPKVKASCMETTNSIPKDMQIIHHRTCESHKLSSKSKIYTWFNQFSILLQRSLKERRHETFNSLRIFQVLAASLLAGSMWWHSDYRDIQDRLGLLFFISIFWGVFPSFNAVFAFPQERAIFLKERASGMYTLSSYFIARITGDLPMELILPTLFLTVTYWMTGLKPELGSFLLTLMVLLGYVLVSQGLGLALGALIMDAKHASTVVTVTMLAFVLTGGYYVHKVPSCMAWIKYISTTFYSYRLLIDIQYGEGKEISSMLGCLHHERDRASCRFIEEDIGGQIHPAMSVGILLIMFFGYRLVAYIALRRMRA